MQPPGSSSEQGRGAVLVADGPTAVRIHTASSERFALKGK
jgi:hypothetical protein